MSMREETLPVSKEKDFPLWGRWREAPDEVNKECAKRRILYYKIVDKFAIIYGEIMNLFK